MIQTAQRDSTKGGLCQWSLWQKITLLLWLPITDSVTKQLSRPVTYNARTMSRGAQLGFSKNSSSTYIHGFKGSFSYSCKSYRASPRPEKRKKKKFPLRCCIVGQCKRKILNTFSKAPVLSQDVSFCCSITFHPFFTGLILNAGIKEASKSWREADVCWGWHRWNEAHFSADQPTSLFSLPLSLNVSVSRCERTWQPGTPSNTWLLWINKKQLILEAACCISLQLMRPPMAWDK